MANKVKTSLNLDAELMHLLKIKAAIENISLTEAMEAAIEQYVKEVCAQVQLKK